MVPVPLISMLAQNGIINLVPNIGNEEGVGLLNGLLKLITPFSLTYANKNMYIVTCPCNYQELI